MITLGVIQSLDNLNNFCKVRLPTLEGAGNKNVVELSATMMLPPGIGAGYEVGDVVFVSFVDNTLGRPMILGQLYKGPNKGTRVDNIGNDGDNSLGSAMSMTCSELLAKDKATIPQTTNFIGAPDGYDTPNQLINKIMTLENKVEALENKVETLQAALISLAGVCSGGFSLINPLTAAACLGIGGILGVSVVAEEFAADPVKED